MSGESPKTSGKIEVRLRTEDRDRILEHTFVDTKTKRLLGLASVRDDHLVVRMTLADLDHLLGHIAATANHARSRRVEQMMDELYGRLKAVEDQHKEV